ncbi:MAG: AI-2E family transporter [Candidatus Gracilibacteria bacterium]
MNQDLVLFLQKLLIVVGAVILFLFFKSFGALFAPVVIAFILSLFFVPLLDKLNKYRIGDGVGIFVSLFVFIVFLSTIIFLVVPIFVRELIKFFDVINRYIIKVQTAVFQGDFSTLGLPDWMIGYIHDYASTQDINNLLTTLSANTSQIVSFISGSATNVLQAGKGIFVSVASTTFLIATTTILTVFFLIERKRVAYVIRSLVPQNWSLEYDTIVHESYSIIGKWAKGQMILSFSIFLLTFVLLHLANAMFGLGLTNIGTLAFLAGLLENIPYLGPVLSLIPALAIALGISTKATIIVVIIYILIQQVENNLLVPQVMSKALSISPLLTIIVMFIATGVLGLLGTLFAVPLTALIELLYHRWQIKRTNGAGMLHDVLSVRESRAYNSLIARLYRSTKKFVLRKK